MRIILVLLAIIVLIYFFYSRISYENYFIRNILRAAMLVLSIILIVILLSAFWGHSI